MIIKTDITNDYLDTAYPGVGKIIRAQGFISQHHDDEIAMAKWILRTFGGNITLLEERNEESPDYFWRGKYWDLKTPEKKNSVTKRIQKGLSQIFNNPGGVILDIRKLDIEFDRLDEIIDGRMKLSLKKSVDIIIVRDEDLIKVLRYNR